MTILGSLPVVKGDDEDRVLVGEAAGPRIIVSRLAKNKATTVDGQERRISHTGR